MNNRWGNAGAGMLVKAMKDRADLLHALRELYPLAEVGAEVLTDQRNGYPEGELALEAAGELLKRFEGA